MANNLYRTPSAENLYIGSGVVYLDRWKKVNGIWTPQGERHLGNCDIFDAETNPNKLTKKSNMTHNKTVYKEITLGMEPKFTVKMTEFDPANLALSLMGEEGMFSQAAATAAKKGWQTVKLGHYYKLPHRKISNAVVKDCAVSGANLVAGTTTYVEGVDYVVEAELGRVYVHPDGAIAESSGIFVTYDAAAFSIPRVIAAVSVATEGSLRFVGDPTTGPVQEIEAWHVSLSAKGKQGFIGETWAENDLEVSCLDDSKNHPDNPYYHVLYWN